MAGLKAIAIMALIVVVALAGVSPAYGASLEVAPTTGCPGTAVTLLATGPSSSISLQTGGPVELFAEDGSCQVSVNGGVTLGCAFVISESVCSGSYTITFTSGSESVTAYFYVLSTCSGVQPCEVGAPVGGFIQPVNTFALLSPWLAVVGVVGCISAAVVVTKKRR